MPPEARLGGGGSSAESALAWNEFAAADAADWDNFDDEGTLVSSTRLSCQIQAVVQDACRMLAFGLYSLLKQTCDIF